MKHGRRLLAHTADAGLEAWGASLGEVYAEAAVALFEVMGTPATLAPAPPLDVEATGVDRADLLVRLLAELLARFEIDGVFVTSATCTCVDVRPDGDLHAALRCEGGRVDHRRETGLSAVKAVTYHGLEVRDEEGGLRARVYVDV